MGVFGPEPVHPRRDGFRPRYRRAAGRGRRRQRAALAGPRHGGDHALPAAAELHHSRLRARDVEGPCGEERWQGTGASARSRGLRAVRRRGLRRDTDFMMNVALAKTETGRALSDAFALARERLPGAGKVADARRQAFAAYERVGLAHRPIEEWRYTDLRVLVREVLPLAAAPNAAALKRAGAVLKLHAIEGVRRLVLVDGAFAPKLSETGNPEKGLGIRTLREALKGGDTALHAQLFAPEN